MALTWMATWEAGLVPGRVPDHNTMLLAGKLARKVFAIPFVGLCILEMLMPE